MVATLIVYSLISVMSLIFSSIKQTSKNKKFFLFLCAVIFIGQMALINPKNTQTDIMMYYYTFERSKSLTLSYIFDTYKYEQGYQILNWIVAKTLKNWTYFIIIFYGFVYFFICRFIYKYSNNIYLSMILFITLGFYGFSLTGLRQTIAISICLWSYDYIKKRKLIPFLLVVLLAFSFHKSAIIFIPLYFLGNLRIKPLSLILIFIICAFIFIYSSNIMDFFNDQFDKSYSKENIKSYTGRVINLFIYFLLLILSLVCSYNKKRAMNNYNVNNTFIISTLIGIAIYLTQFFDVGISYRLSMYYVNTFIFVYVSNIINEFDLKKDKRLLTLCFIIFSTLLFFIGIYRNNLYNFTYYI